MKRIYIYIVFTLLCIVAVSTSCNKDYDYDNLIPDEYTSVLYLKESGRVNLQLFKTSTEYNHSVSIIKAGKDPKASAEVNIELMTQEEVDNLYGTSDGVKYKILPSSAFSLNNGQAISFGAEDKNKEISIKFITEEIAKAIKDEDDATLVLPLRLVSEKSAIYSEKNTLFYTFKVESPIVALEVSGNGVREEDLFFKTLDIGLVANVENSEENQWNFTCSIDKNTANWTTLVHKFNDDFGTNYEVLPTAALTIDDDFIFTKGNSSANAKLTVNRAQLVNDHEYLFPVVLSKTSLEGLETSDRIMYVIIRNPRLGLRLVDRSNWKIKFCNSDIMQSPRVPGWPFLHGMSGPEKIFDGKTDTYWCGQWDSKLPWDDTREGVNFKWEYPDNDDYNYNFTQWHGFNAIRGNQALVLDMVNPVYIAEIGFIQGPENLNENNRDMKRLQFSISNDNAFSFKPFKSGGNVNDYENPSLNNWTMFMDWKNIPQRGDLMWNKVEDNKLGDASTKGRLLKIYVADSYRPNICGMTELYVKELVSINGEPVN